MSLSATGLLIHAVPGILGALGRRVKRRGFAAQAATGLGGEKSDHARSTREWADIPPRPVRLDQLITTKNVLDLQMVLDEDSTFYGDLFPHVIRWQGELYLEDGLHRALRAALHQRSVLHARVLELD
jgi:Arc/MetJ family transcription regulator